ncbi:bifunctional cobalt-precorrin-7 (C(5))-methyltransferase/cobalt-precorrin-6B (C(15))-methyltransferase [Actinokineospora iranica]|uniref:Precorrin-6Y C5,15-methyltransferase (Decarboxylating) n=1 Tax=Actinokineospora iranica TaxID=1271860 RepID=A0A1G6NG01_9PSEU|nr:bifunctional cobalt-precorrin-7 (C(5))-methyltransferase CbiE/decarboxylating cobalt-precorrin-6B (C(15))-methyltransferase CbiT [Actinokineospora iranica]SDC66738.1 precorrin-6Y C5,15-methyltransferase (decarboxylating) [Actinokineospora iranica]
MTASVTVIGVDGQSLPPGAEAALASAGLVVGLRPLLAAYAGEARRLELAGSAFGEATVDTLAQAVTAGESAVVLIQGDPGYFGGLRALRARGVPTVTWPSVTDVQRMAAMIKRPWDDLTVVSARGSGFRHAVNVCRARKAVAVLTGPDAGPAELARELDGWRRNIAVLEDLGGPAEKLSIVDVTEAERRSWREPNLVLCLVSLDAVGRDQWIAGGEVVPPEDGWALAESAFATRAGVGVPPEVRALALARLAPRPGALVWDVCAGSGAVGIEAARLGAAVIAVERDSGLCVRIVANAGAHGVDVRLADGDPPAVLASLPRPDSVFVGDSRPDVVRACAEVDAARVVVLVPELDRLGQTRKTLADAGYAVDGCHLTTSNLVELSEDTMGVVPASSTFLVWGSRK